MFDAIYNWAVLQLFAGINELVVMMLIWSQGLKELGLRAGHEGPPHKGVTQIVISKPHLKLYALIVSAERLLYAKFQLPVHTPSVSKQVTTFTHTVTILERSFVLFNYLEKNTTWWKNSISYTFSRILMLISGVLARHLSMATRVWFPFAITLSICLFQTPLLSNVTPR
jgi:hypothetical protein